MANIQIPEKLFFDILIHFESDHPDDDQILPQLREKHRRIVAHNTYKEKNYETNISAN